MNITKEKIIKTAIDQFNQHGVGNVRIKDIAMAADMSPGNLTYHFKTKKDLICAVYIHLRTALDNLTLGHQIFIKGNKWLDIIHRYLNFQIEFRFFFRDTLEIIHLYPEVKDYYRKQIQTIVDFNKNGLFLAVGRGYLILEPHEGHYESLAKNNWAILNSWLTEREILGYEEIDIMDGIRAILELHFPYFTEKGKEFYYAVTKDLPKALNKGLVD